METTFESRKVYAKLQLDFETNRVCLASVFDYRSISASPSLLEASSSSDENGGSGGGGGGRGGGGEGVSNLARTLAPLTRWASASSSSSSNAMPNVAHSEVLTGSSNSSSHFNENHNGAEVAPRPARDGLWVCARLLHSSVRASRRGTDVWRIDRRAIWREGWWRRWTEPTGRVPLGKLHRPRRFVVSAGTDCEASTAGTRRTSTPRSRRDCAPHPGRTGISVPTSCLRWVPFFFFFSFLPS